MKSLFRDFDPFRTNFFIFQHKDTEKISPHAASVQDDKKRKPSIDAEAAVKRAQDSLNEVDANRNFAQTLKLLGAAIVIEQTSKQLIGGQTLLERFDLKESKPDEITLDQMKLELDDPALGPDLRKALALYAVELLQNEFDGKYMLARLGIDSHKSLDNEQLEAWFNNPQLVKYLRMGFAVISAEILQRKMKGRGVLERLEIEDKSKRE